MDRPLATVVIILVVVLMLGAMALSWWARKKRQSGYAELAAVPADLGVRLGEFEGLYLATTPAGEPLDRIVVRGLGFRARTTLELTEHGIVFMADRYLPRESVTGIGRASWTIDRGVEPDGLSVISWTLGDASVESYFRLDDPEGFITVGTQFMKKAEEK